MKVTRAVPARPSHADSSQSSIHKKGYNSQPDTHTHTHTHTHAVSITKARCFMLFGQNAVYSRNRTQHDSYTRRYHLALRAAVAHNPACILNPAATNQFATCACNMHRKQAGKSAAPHRGPLQTITQMGDSLQSLSHATESHVKSKHLVNIFPALYETRRLITLFTNVTVLGQINPAHTCPIVSVGYILILSSNLHLGIPNSLSPPFQVSPPQPCMFFPSPPHMLHFPPISTSGYLNSTDGPIFQLKQ